MNDAPDPPSTVEKDARRDVRLVSGDALQAALYSVDAVHQFHGDACLCGFKSPRSRSRTEHITTEVMVALARVTSPGERHQSVNLLDPFTPPPGVQS